MAALALGIAIFLGFDIAVFRSGFYAQWVDPGSRSGAVLHALEMPTHAPAGQRMIIMLGDSRVNEGFSQNLANEIAAGTGWTFVNSAVPSSTPRAWYYLLREILRRGHRPAVLAVMQHSYHDNDMENLSNRRLDIGLVHNILGLGDLLDFPASFTSEEARIDAARAILLAGLYYKSDVANLLPRLHKRWRDVSAWRRRGFEFLTGHQGLSPSLEGLRFDMASGALEMPPSVPPPVQAMLGRYAQTLRETKGRPADNAFSAAYRAVWLDRISELCTAYGIRLVFFRVPRGPLHFLAEADEEASGALARLRDAGLARLLPAGQFDELEQPALFADELHLNAAGRRPFSRELSTAILAVLQGSE